MEWTTENMKWFFGQTPPRQLDDALLNDALNLVFPKFVRVLFYVMPVLLLAMMGMFLAVISRTSDLKGEWRLWTKPIAQASGKVVKLERLKGSKGSITYVTHFEFKPLGTEAVDALPVKGLCFSSNQLASEGQLVEIEYLPDDPKISRIQGSRLNPIALEMVIFVPLLAVLAALLPLGMLRHKKKWLRRILAFGILLPAAIERVKAGPKGSLVAELRYNVDGAEIKSKTNLRGRKQEKEWLNACMESGQSVMLLVDPRQTKSVFLLDLLLNVR